MYLPLILTASIASGSPGVCVENATAGKIRISVIRSGGDIWIPVDSYLVGPAGKKCLPRTLAGGLTRYRIDVRHGDEFEDRHTTPWTFLDTCGSPNSDDAKMVVTLENDAFRCVVVASPASRDN